MMANQSYDNALDFLPQSEPDRKGRLATALGTLKSIFTAMGDGLEAQRQYKLLTSRGMQPAVAAEKVLCNNIGRG